MAINRITSDIIEALSASKPKTQAYDTEAQVVRVEGNTAWVHIPGGVDETPVALTINASEGDTVRVRVAGGTAWIMGNDSAPPTDDKAAMVAIRNSMEAVNIAKEMTIITEDLSQRIANANGLYETQQVTPGGATITYMHNKPLLAESDIQIMISDVGVMVTANGTDPTPTWYGLEVNGNLIANILSANGINADWINAGALVIYDNNNNEIFRADKTNKVLKWDMTLSSLSKLGLLTFTEDSPQASQMINHASLRVVNKYYTQTLGDFATELFAANGMRTGVVSSWGSVTINGETIQIPNYKQSGTYTYNGIDIVDNSSTQHIVFRVEENKNTSDRLLGGSKLTVNGRSLEDWVYRAAVIIESNTNVNSYDKPGNYVCMNGTVAATLTNAPFTNSSFQMITYQYTSSNQRMQIAWQNATATNIKYRSRTDGGTWGPWYTLAVTATPTFTINSSYFTLTRNSLSMSGRIVAVNIVASTKSALSANTVYTMGTFSVNATGVYPIYGKDGNQNVQNTYISGTSPNYNTLYIRPNVAIASGTAVEVTGTFIV